jgi:uncharacterized protein YccT (UPF0319 family)
MHRLFILALSCLLAACAQQSHVQLYSGPALPASQVVTLFVPSELEVQSINGQRVADANAFGTDDRELHLQPGTYQVSAYYKKGFDIDGGISHEIVRGRTAVFSFDGQAGELWRLEFAQPQSLQQAKLFENKFDAWALNTRTGERRVSQAGQRNNSLINALLGDADDNDDGSTVAPLNAAAAPGTATAAPSPRAVDVAPSPAASETLPHNDATLTTLQQLWNLLSPESRKAFLEWAQQ